MTAALPLAASIGPIGIVAISVCFVVIAIGVCRLNAFFALIFAALLTGVLTVFSSSMHQTLVSAVDEVMRAFGTTVGKVGFTIALASVIGMCLMESGAADKIVRRFIAVLGEGQAALALLICGFILSAPVFIDTVIMLLLPLARALSLRTGKNYLLYVLVICAGGSISNGIIPPAPGPLLVADKLGIDLGFAISGGVLFGILPALGALLLARWFDKRIHVPVRAISGSTLESLEAVATRGEDELPSFLASITPVLLPILMIAGASTYRLLAGHRPSFFSELMDFLGNKNIALLVGAMIAVYVYARQKGIHWRNVGSTLSGPLETAGIIILITSAGGAFGDMIKTAGVGESVRGLIGANALNYVFIAWLTSALLRAAQGSATVATITAVGIMGSIAGPSGFGVHPLYIFLAIGFGSKFLAWMNDSGFWVICRLGGLTQGETLRSWTILVSLVSILGLVEVLIVSSLFPHLPFLPVATGH